MKNAVIYARYSSERQTEQSIEGQLRVCNEYAERNDLKIIDTYIDRAMTGRNDQREAFQKMLADSAKPVSWDIVLVYAIDRFGRNSIEIAVNKQKLKKNNKTLISATQRTSDNIDGTKNLDGILLENVYIGLAEYYSAELAQKVRRGQTESLRKGHWLGGQTPYGYKVVDKKLVIDEDQAEIVKYIYRQYSAGVIVKDIIQDLTQRGIYNKGKPFTRSTMYYLLANEKYSGVFHYNGETYLNICPKLLPDSLYNKVHALMLQNQFGTKSVEVNYLLRGKVYCGYCGHQIIAESGTSMTGVVKRYYKCGGRKANSGCQKKNIRKEDLEELVINVTVEMFQQENNLELIADEIMKIFKDKKKEHSVISLLTSELQNTQRAIENLLTAIQQGIITTSTKSRLVEMEEKAEELKTQITKEQAKLENRISKELIIEYLRTGIKKSPQALIDWLIDKVILYDDKIEIYYLYTEKTDPDDCRGFVIRWWIFRFETRHYSKNELNKRVQLIPTWLPLADSNCRHCG